MKSKSVIIILFFLFASLTTVVGFDIPSTTAPSGYSYNVNYLTTAYDDNILEASSTYQSSLQLYSVPVVCDIDNDGIREIITYSGNTISIVHRDATGFYLEKSITISPYNNDTDTQINWIACMSDESGTWTSTRKVLGVHQGTTTGKSEISFIGYNVDIDESDPTGTTDYGDGFSKFGGYLNMPMTKGGVSCDSFRYTFEGDNRVRTRCAYVHATQNEIVYINELTKIVEIGGVSGEWQLFYNQTSFEILYPAYTPVILTDVGGQTVTSMLSGNPLVSTGTPLAFVFGQNNQPIFFFSFINSGGGTRYGRATLTGTTTTTFLLPATNPLFQTTGSWITTDIDGDGFKDACYIGQGGGGAVDIRSLAWCGTSAGVELLDIYPATGQDVVFRAISAYDITNNGDKEIFIYQFSNDNADNDLLIYLGNDNGYTHPINVKAENVNLGTFYTMPIVKISDTEFVIIAGGNTFRINNAVPSATTIAEEQPLTGLTTYDMAIQTDVDFDYKTESMFIDKNTGTFRLYYHDELPLVPTISLVNSTRYGGGYFGWDALSCLDSPVVIKATECTDGQSVCTYENTIQFERERLCTTCGGTQSIFCGNYSYASPEISCNFVSAGDKTIQVYIETESKVGLAQGLATFIVELSATDLSCNSNILTAPATFVDPDQPTTPDPEEPDSEKSQLELYYEDWLQTLDDSVPRPIQLIASILLMAFMGIWIHKETNGNNYMTILGSLFGAGVSVALGLLAIELVLIVGIGLLVFVFVAYKFDKFGGRT